MSEIIVELSVVVVAVVVGGGGDGDGAVFERGIERDCSCTGQTFFLFHSLSIKRLRVGRLVCWWPASKPMWV